MEIRILNINLHKMRNSRLARKLYLSLAMPTALLMTGPSAFSSDKVPNILNQERHYTELNAQNLGDKQYSAALPDASATQFKFKLKGYVFGLRMIKANYSGWFDNTRYTVYADLQTSGLGALLKKLEIWAVSSGMHNSNIGVRPDYHVQQNLDKKNRRVEMNYDGVQKHVDVNILPPLGSQGIPAATPAERYSAHDTLSAIMAIMMQKKYNDGNICDAIVPVFDSKQHYNLRMERVGTRRVKFNGKKAQTIRCHTYYEPVSGFDPEDLPDDEETATPVNVYLHYQPELDLYIPVRFTYKISAITAVIKITDIDIIPSADQPVVSEQSAIALPGDTP
ncbi:MAG: DUF3108 domain-containing protein [Litorimonas sp.]